MSASVGIVWGVPDGRPGLHLVTDCTPLAEAEPYGDCLTHPRGHCEVWEDWRRLGPAELKRRGLPVAIAWHEYEEFPRGRVVFHTGSFRFTLYADPKLRRASVLGGILRVFGLDPARCDVRSDPHYRTPCARLGGDRPVDAAPGTALHARPRNEPGYPTHIVQTTAVRFHSDGVSMSTRSRHRTGGGLT